MRLRTHPLIVHARAASALLVVLLALLAGCSTSPPADAFKLPPTSLADRQMQSRRFDTMDQQDLLAASVGVLQDLGYALDVSNADLGVLTASKELDAENSGQIAAAILLAVLGQSPQPWDDDQRVRVCLVVNQSLENPEASLVRITISRVIWNTQGQITRAETLNVPELYQAFFDKLSKATFLQAHEI
jgi:hypothetical protein